MQNREQLQQWESTWVTAPITVQSHDIWSVIDELKFRYLRTLLPATGRTLEVGCGSARLSSSLAQTGFWTVGLDYTSSAFPAARENYYRRGVEGEFVRGDAERLPFADSSFDVVFSTGLLEHFRNVQPLVNEMGRVLKPGGLLYSDIVPNKFSLFRSLDWLSLRALRGRPDPTLVFERGFSKNEIVELWTRAGCERVRVFGMAILPPHKLFPPRAPRLVALEYQLAHRLSRALTSLDDTRLAEWLGFLYFAYGYKPTRAFQP